MGRKKKIDLENAEVVEVTEDEVTENSGEGKVNELFEERLKTLLKLAKKKKNVLDPDEVSKHFEGVNMGEEEYERLQEFMDANGIDTFRAMDDDLDSIS